MKQAKRGVAIMADETRNIVKTIFVIAFSSKLTYGGYKLSWLNRSVNLSRR